MSINIYSPKPLYLYRKAITIAHSDDGAQSDYQVKLLIGESSGATGEQFDLGGHISDKTAFNDLRFTSADGDNCPYWIESITGVTPNQLATVWVKIPYIYAHPIDTIIYCYYGNAGAPAASSGADTFIVFEDFEGFNDEDDVDSGDGKAAWTKTVAGTSTAKIDDDISMWGGGGAAGGGTKGLRLYRDGTNNPAAYASNVTAGSDISIRWRMYKAETSRVDANHSNGTKTLIYRVEGDEDISYYDGSTYVDTGINAAVTTWQLYEANNFVWGTPTCDLWFEGAKIVNDASINYASVIVANAIRFSVTAGDYGWIDDVIVRKWTANEPAFSSAGSEEDVSSYYKNSHGSILIE